MKEKLKAAIYGFAVGDALGVPFEFRTRDTFECTDMIAALTGGLAGLKYGFDNIPKSWIDALAAKDTLDMQIEKFGKIISA